MISLVAMEIDAQTVAAAKLLGRKGGLKRNPRKGFGTGDNAKRAARIRWEKYRLTHNKK